MREVLCQVVILLIELQINDQRLNGLVKATTTIASESDCCSQVVASVEG